MVPRSTLALSIGTKEMKKERHKPHEAISTGQLNALQRLHLRPIDVVVLRRLFRGCPGRPSLEVCFPLRCFQRVIDPDTATSGATGVKLVHRRSVQPGPLVLRSGLSSLHATAIGTKLSHDVLNPARVPL